MGIKAYIGDLDKVRIKSCGYVGKDKQIYVNGVMLKSVTDFKIEVSANGVDKVTITLDADVLLEQDNKEVDMVDIIGKQLYERIHKAMMNS